MRQSKYDIVKAYNDLKAQAGGTPPHYRDFLKKSGISRRELDRIFGSTPYSKLQELAGDAPNRLDMERTSIADVMSAYGDLGSKVFAAEGRLPVGADWIQNGLRPTERGLNKTHGIYWSNFHKKFFDYCNTDSALAEKHANFLNFIRENEDSESSAAINKQGQLIQKVSSQIRGWSPALRRNSEEAYKSELSLHLRSENTGLRIREERGDSQCDIAVGSDIAIELKKSPTQADYDRCFGQIARHLQSYEDVIVVLFDVPRRDPFEDFSQLVDLYYPGRVTIIRND